MILDTLPDVQKLTPEEKTPLAEELLDELNAPKLSDDQDKAILEVLNERMEAYRAGNMTGSSWSEVRERLRVKTGASWQK